MISMKKEFKIILGLLAIIMVSGSIFYLISGNIAEYMITELNDSNNSNKTISTTTYNYTNNGTHNGTEHTVTVTTIDYD